MEGPRRTAGRGAAPLLAPPTTACRAQRRDLGGAWGGPGGTPPGSWNASGVCCEFSCGTQPAGLGSRIVRACALPKDAVLLKFDAGRAGLLSS